MIDPNISLSVKPMTGIGPDYAAIQNQQQVNQKIAESNAAMPGVQADALMKARVNESQQWMQNNASKYKDANGTLDLPKVINGLASAGFADSAEALLGHHLQNNILNTNDVKNRYDLVKNSQENVANILSGMPSETRNDALQKYKTGFNLGGTSPFSNVKMGDELASKFYAYDIDGSIIRDPNGTPAIDDAKVQAYKNSSMSPETQAAITRYKLQDHTTQESLNPNSSVSKATQELAIQLGLARAGDAPQSDYYWNTRPDFGIAAKNNVASSDMMTKQTLDANEYLGKKQLAQSTIDSLYNTPLLKTDQWKGGAALSNIMNSFSNDPSVNALKSMLEKAKAIDPTLDINTQDGPSILNKLQTISTYNDKMYKLNTDRIKSTISNVSGIDTTGGSPANPTQNTEPSVVPKSTKRSPTVRSKDQGDQTGLQTGLQVPTKVSPKVQAERDSDAKAIISSELSKTIEDQKNLVSQYNNGNVPRNAGESQAAYDKRVQDIKGKMELNAGDISALRRELSRFGDSGNSGLVPPTKSIQPQGQSQGQGQDKVITMDEINKWSKERNKSVSELIQRAKERGYTIK